jgi:hypothetical protein
VTVVTKLAALTAALLVGSLVAGCGGSSSPRDELSHFVVDYVDHNRGNCCELGMKAKVDHITFAGSNPRWALVSIAVTDINGNPDGTDFLVLRKPGSTWDVVAFGKGALGCRVPARIRAKLAARAPDGDLRCLAAG